jgi:addiction module RelB/DinJ family antitoxin
MTATNINICTDSELEARAQSVLADLGLDMSTAFNIFLTQVVEKNAVPFEIDKSKPARRKNVKGSERKMCCKTNGNGNKIGIQKKNLLAD